MERGENVSPYVICPLMRRDDYLPLSYFDKIYVVDLCQPLLDVARERCRRKGWTHVEFLCQDASRFILPEWESGQLDPRGSLCAITMSYSLSMVCHSRLRSCIDGIRSLPFINCWTDATKSLISSPVYWVSSTSTPPDLKMAKNAYVLSPFF